MKKHGLSFKKFDLHIHTPASKCFSDKSVTAEQIVAKAIKEGLSAIAITDHNTGEWIDKGIGIKQDKTILNACNKLNKLGFIEIIKKQGKTNEYKLRLLSKIQRCSVKNTEVASVKNTDTIRNVTINNKTIGRYKSLNELLKEHDIKAA